MIISTTATMRTNVNTGYLYGRLLLVAFGLVTVITGYWVQITNDWVLYVSIEYRVLGAETGKHCNVHST